MQSINYYHLRITKSSVTRPVFESSFICPHISMQSHVITAMFKNDIQHSKESVNKGLLFEYIFIKDTLVAS